MILTLQQKLIGLAVWTVLVFGGGFYTAGKFDLAAQAASSNKELKTASDANAKANKIASGLEAGLAEAEDENNKIQGELHEKPVPNNDCPLSVNQLHALRILKPISTASR